MASTHPRRSQKTTLSPMTLQSGNYSIDKSLSSPLSIRKGATFHIPNPTSGLPCRLVRRAESSLEEIVEAHKRRVASTLDDIDASLSAMNLSDARPTTSSFRDDSLPVPQGFLNHTVDKRHRAPAVVMSPISPEAADLSIGRHSLRPRQNRRLSAPSDSGLGSSIASSSSKMSQKQTVGGKAGVSATAISRSVNPTQSLTTRRRLSDRAMKKFRELIFSPLLSIDSIKEFHPLVRDCPRRINENEIVCLRDLEKTLLLMAPVSDNQQDTPAVKAFAYWLSSLLQQRSETAKAYLRFCQLSIHCIQATVEHLNDRELTKPADRPYSSGYFIDLVNQLRNHAKALEATREKERNGETVDDMDVDGSEQVTIYGGLHKNGQPAELVRIRKDGSAISLATGKEVPRESIEEDQDDKMRFKRSASEEALEDDVLRSMARRKASATAGELAPKRCTHSGCSKEFKRACDLTKHEKTHSRPWKCSDATCRYHEYGWPTEKELERHRNDKHSANPKLYNCLFPPCAYSSKRESNCKQHMEKSHNWVYVRSKNNGKNRDQQARGSLPTPQETHLQTPVTEHQQTPEDMRFDDSEGSVNFNPEIYNESHVSYPTDFNYHGELTLDQPQQFHISPADSNMNYSSVNTSPFLENGSEFGAIDNVAVNFGHQNDFTLYEDLYNASARVPSTSSTLPFTMQQYNNLPPTPEKNLFARSYDAPITFPNQVQMSHSTIQPEHISPVGQGNTMLFTPASMMDVDDSFEFIQSDSGMEGDFALFSTTDTTFMPEAKNSLFGDLPSSTAGLSQFAAQDPWGNFYAQTTQMQGEWYDDEAMDMMNLQ